MPLVHEAMASRGMIQAWVMGPTKGHGKGARNAEQAHAPKRGAGTKGDNDGN